MRLLATLAASTALVTLATSATLADPSGYVGISGGLDNLNISYGGDSETADGSQPCSSSPAASTMFTPVLGVQGDIRAAFRTYEQDEFEIDDTSLDGAVRLLPRGRPVPRRCVLPVRRQSAVDRPLRRRCVPQVCRRRSSRSISTT